MIRAMTTDEIRKALRHGAEVCIRHGLICWGRAAVLPQDGAFFAAQEFLTYDETVRSIEDNPEHAATFLLLVAEAIE